MHVNMCFIKFYHLCNSLLCTKSRFWKCQGNLEFLMKIREKLLNYRGKKKIMLKFPKKFSSVWFIYNEKLWNVIFLNKKIPMMDFEGMQSKDERVTFPTTLEGFGYEFQDGKLRNIKTGEAFQFEVKKNDHAYNQKHYEALGEVITEYVYDYIMKEGKLKKLPLPIDANDVEPTTFIFHSEDAFTNPKVIVLIHGTGVVRAGQWARRLIINDCLDSGTQLPFILKAQELGYGVFVLNTNDNKRIVNGIQKKIRHNSCPEAHASYVMEKIIFKNAAAKHIGIIAHSYGGVVTVNMVYELSDSLDKFFAIAFTDSVHRIRVQIPPSQHSIRKWLKEHARNWVSSDEPLDSAPISLDNSDTDIEIDRVSAGTPHHELTSWSSLTSIFKFLEQMYKKHVTK